VPPEILDPGIAVLRFFSRFHGPLWNGIFLAISGMGSTAGYVLLFCLLWWGVSWKLGARLFVALVLSVYVNAAIKDWVREPRPFDYGGVESVIRPGEFSFPSGHAQHAVLVWGLLAAHVRRRSFTLAAAGIAFLIGFSRVALGVHFPSDVLGGWILGGLLAVLYHRWSGSVIDRASRIPLELALALALLLPLGLTLLEGNRNTATALGGLAGALSGLALAGREHLYAEREPPSRRRERLFLGLAGLPLIYLALRAASPAEGDPLHLLYLWARFAVIALWVSYLVPKIVNTFKRRT
jgi:membrane-associated phospholipid phosphatase